ncbi:hypothetical protein OQA88_11513 [Cercophora sp. LCS_1]
MLAILVGFCPKHVDSRFAQKDPLFITYAVVVYVNMLFRAIGLLGPVWFLLRNIDKKYEYISDWRHQNGEYSYGADAENTSPSLTFWCLVAECFIFWTTGLDRD